jgi:hypothetical protein
MLPCSLALNILYCSIAVHGPIDETVNEATESLSKDYGIPVIASAGNWGRCACFVCSVLFMKMYGNAGHLILNLN